MAAVTTAVVGIASAGYSAYQGFSAAAKAKRQGEEAAADAKKAMEDARKKAETDFYEGLTIPLDAYDAEFENNLAVAQQTTEALQEGDARALAAGAGRVGATSAEQAEQQRIAMGKEVAGLQATKAQSKDAINQQLMEMDVAYAKEQKQIAADAQKARADAMQQGIQGAAGVVTGVASMVPLFPGKAKPTPTGGGADLSSAGLSLSGGGGGGTSSPLSLSGGGGGGPMSHLSLSGGQPSQFGSFLQRDFTSGLSPTSNIFSDRRLKENINLIGQSPSGLNIYSFKYKNEEGMYQGVMSDEIDQAAVIRVGEYDMVNYAMIDVEFKEI